MIRGSKRKCSKDQKEEEIFSIKDDRWQTTEEEEEGRAVRAKKIGKITQMMEALRYRGDPID